VKPKEKSVVKDDGWKGYVNWQPLAAEREMVEKYGNRSSFAVDEEISGLVESGYSVSFSHEEKTGAVRVAVTGKTKPCPNIGYTLSIRASSVARAMAVVGYYCFTICGGGDWLVEKNGDDVW